MQSHTLKCQNIAHARTAEDAEDAAGLSQEEYLLLTNRLHTVLRPFMLRRLKEAVAGELPGKSEVVIKCRMGPYQEVTIIYEHLNFDALTFGLN